MLESLFNTVAGLNTSDGCFFYSLTKFLKKLRLRCFTRFSESASDQNTLIDHYANLNKKEYSSRGSHQTKAYNFIKKRLRHKCFPVEYWEIFKNIYFEEQLRTATSEVLNRNPLRSLHFLTRNALLFLEQALTTSLRLTVMDLTYKWSDSICNSEKLEKSRANHNVYCSIIVQIQHFQLQKYQINAQNKSLLNGLP